MDRDGVINEIFYDSELGLVDSPLNPSQFNLLPGVTEAIKLFNDMNLKVIVVSNQPAIAKGKMTLELFEQVRNKMNAMLELKGAHLDAEYYCLHHPEAKLSEYRIECDCRKPKPGLILQASKDFNLDLSKCYLIGDSLTDIKAGLLAGCQTYLIGTPKCDLCHLMGEKNIKPSRIIPNLIHGSKIIEEIEHGNIP